MKMYLTRHPFARGLSVFLHSFRTETLILKIFFPGLTNRKDDVPKITKTREHSSLSSAILPKHLENRVPIGPIPRLSPKHGFPGFGSQQCYTLKLKYWTKVFSSKGTVPVSKPPLSSQKTQQTKPQHVRRVHVWSVVSLYLWVLGKTKSSRSSFFSGFTDDDSVFKLHVPFTQDFTSYGCTTQFLMEPYN